MWENDYEIRNVSWFGRGAELGFGGNSNSAAASSSEWEREIWAICLDLLDNERRGLPF